MPKLLQLALRGTTIMVLMRAKLKSTAGMVAHGIKGEYHFMGQLQEID